jgi:hypothetical protein
MVLWSDTIGKSDHWKILQNLLGGNLNRQTIRTKLHIPNMPREYTRMFTGLLFHRQAEKSVPDEASRLW